MNYLLSTLLLLYASIHLSAQETMQEMLDDGQAGSEKLVLKTNFLTMLNGDFPLLAELRISSRFYLEAGVGFVAGYLQKELPYYLTSDHPFDLDNGGKLAVGRGYSLQLAPRFYLLGSDFNGVSMGPFWRRRTYRIKDHGGDAVTSDWGVMFGQQHRLKKQFFLEYFFGLGFRKLELPDDLKAKHATQIAMPWSFKIGYGF